MKTIQAIEWENEVWPADFLEDFSQCKKCKDAIFVDELVEHIICGSKKIEKFKTVFTKTDSGYICQSLNTGD
jgi:hypothetical protein